jgi:hypothetical protein
VIEENTGDLVRGMRLWGKVPGYEALLRDSFVLIRSSAVCLYLMGLHSIGTCRHLARLCSL